MKNQCILPEILLRCCLLESLLQLQCFFCAVVHLIYVRLTSTCTVGPSHHHEEIMFLWCHCSETSQMLTRKLRLSSLLLCICLLICSLFLQWFPAVSGMMWSWCFDAWVSVLCLSFDDGVLQHTHPQPQTAAFPIQIAECRTHLHLEPTACIMVLLWLSKASSFYSVLFGRIWRADDA